MPQQHNPVEHKHFGSDMRVARAKATPHTWEACVMFMCWQPFGSIDRSLHDVCKNQQCKKKNNEKRLLESEQSEQRAVQGW